MPQHQPEVFLERASVNGQKADGQRQRRQQHNDITGAADGELQRLCAEEIAADAERNGAQSADQLPGGHSAHDFFPVFVDFHRDINI